MDRDSLTNTLKKATANAYDVYFDLYTTYFEKGDAPEEALEVILDYPGKIGDTKDKNPQRIKLQEEKRITFVFEDLICGIAGRIAEMDYSKKDFYKKLYEAVFCSDSELLPQSKAEKVIALKILSEQAVAVPYYKISGIERFEEDEFEEIVMKIRPQVQEAFCMLQRQFPMMPEMVSQLLRIADSISDKRQRVVFWTIVMSKLRNDDRN